MDWNYNKIISNNDNEQIYFFTNNIVESTNRTINLHYGGNIKSVLNFKNCISELIEIFDKKQFIKKINCLSLEQFHILLKTNLIMN